MSENEPQYVEIVESAPLKQMLKTALEKNNWIVDNIQYDEKEFGNGQTIARGSIIINGITPNYEDDDMGYHTHFECNAGTVKDDFVFDEIEVIITGE